MDLTDEQWALIQPLIPPPSPYSRGRPPADPRAVLDGIFRKLRLGDPWYILPTVAEGRHPSWQTCYRAYRRWESVGILDQVFKILYRHLCDQGGFDPYASLWIQTDTAGPYQVAGGAEDSDPGSGNFHQNPGQAAVIIKVAKSGWHLSLPPDLENTWQGSTALLLVQGLITKVKSSLKLAL